MSSIDFPPGKRKKITKEDLKLTPKPTIEDQAQPFNPAEFRKFANKTIDDLKKQLRDQGVSPAEVAKAWQPARLLHDKIQKSLLEYRDAESDAERTRLSMLARQQLAELQHEATEEVHEALQEKVRAKPRERGELKPEFPPQFHDAYKKAVNAEARAALEREQNIVANLRAEIKHFEELAKTGGSAKRAEYEQEILRLEGEIRRHEELAKGELPGTAKARKEAAKKKAEEPAKAAEAVAEPAAPPASEPPPVEPPSPESPPAAAPQPAAEPVSEPGPDMPPPRVAEADGPPHIDAEHVPSGTGPHPMSPDEWAKIRAGATDGHFEDMAHPSEADIRPGTEGTPGENKKKLAGLLERIKKVQEGWKESNAKAGEVFASEVAATDAHQKAEFAKYMPDLDSKEWKMGLLDAIKTVEKPDPSTPEGAHALRHEQDAEKYFNRLGLTVELATLRVLRQREKDAIKEFYGDKGRFERGYAEGTGLGTENMRHAKMAVEEAAGRLNKALREKMEDPASTLTKAERIKIKVLGLNETAWGPDAMRTKVRGEALGARGKDVIDRVGGASRAVDGWLNRHLGETGARAAKIIGISALFATAGAGLGAFTVSGALGYAGWRILRGLGGTTLGSIAGSAAGKAFDLTQNKKAAGQAKEARDASAESAADVRKQSTTMKRGSLTGRAAQRARVEKLTAALVGGGTGFLSAILGEWSHVSAVSKAENLLKGNAPQSELPKVITEPEHRANIRGWNQLHPDKPFPGDGPASKAIIESQQQAGTPLGGSAAPADAAPSQLRGTAVDGGNNGPAVPLNAAPVAIEHPEQLTETIKPGEGADQMWRHLQQKLTDQGFSKDGTTTPAAFKEILSKDPHELSNQFYFHRGGGENGPLQSAVMYEGDSMSVTPSGDVVFTPKGGEAMTLFHSTSMDQYEVGSKVASPAYQNDVIPRPAVAEQVVQTGGAHTTAADNAAEIERTRALNLGPEHYGPPKPEGLPPTPPDIHDVLAGQAQTAAPGVPAVVDTVVQPEAPQDFVSKLESTPSTGARSLIDTEISRNGISDPLVSELITAAPRLPVDPSLVQYVEPNTGVIPGPAVFLGHNGQLTVYGAAEGDMYKKQLEVAQAFAQKSGHDVNVLFPDGQRGHAIVHPNGTVTAETGGTFRRYVAPPGVQDSVYVFNRNA